MSATPPQNFSVARDRKTALRFIRCRKNLQLQKIIVIPLIRSHRIGSHLGWRREEQRAPREEEKFQLTQRGKNMFRKLLVCTALVAGSAAANAGNVLLDESFENLGTTNLLPDWYSYDLTSPACSPSASPGCANPWEVGNPGVFSAQAGSADSYIASSAFSAAFGGNVDNWLITPLLHNSAGVFDLSFYTKTEGALPGDNLEVLVNSSSSAAFPNVLGDWVSMGSIGAYPSDWSLFNFQYIGTASDVRFAFRYTVTDTSQNGDYIGIDSVRVSVPEPGTLALMAAGMLLVPLVMRRRRTQI